MMRGTRLTAHFTVDEVLGNSSLSSVPAAQRDAVLLTVARMETLRTLFGGRAVRVHDWLRTQLENVATGGSDTSDHPNGYAVDFSVAGMSPRQIMLAIAGQRAQLGIDQAIEYATHVHVSFNPRARGELLIKTPTGFAPWTAATKEPAPMPSEKSPTPNTPPNPPQGSAAWWLLLIAGILTAIGTMIAANGAPPAGP